MKPRIYLDHHATTPVDPSVVDAMLPYFREQFGNAASRTHVFGWEADEGVENARGQVAALLGARTKEIVFTSGATESNNLAILGAVEASGRELPHVITCATEHPAVLDPCSALEKAGRARVTVVPVDRSGLVDPDAIARAIDADTVLVTIMTVNNEIGTIHPIEEIGRMTRERGVLLHTDATQAVGVLEMDVAKLGVDLLSLSAHKIYGPKGVGALYVRSIVPRIRLAPSLHGGGHERGLRSGTLNVPGIVGLGRAAALARTRRSVDVPQIAALRDHLWHRLSTEIEGVVRNGNASHSHPGNLNVSFSHVEAESLLMSIDREIAISSGSACTSATLQPSHVLRAIGVRDEAAESSARFGLGRENTLEEIDRVADRIAAEVKRLRALSPTWGRSERRVADGGAP